MIEIIGIVSTIFILISMLFKTTTLKGSIWMRGLNIVGSIIFVVYGVLLPAISTAVLNGVLVFVNAYHFIMLIKEYKKSQTSAAKTQETTSKETD